MRNGAAACLGQASCAARPSRSRCKKVRFVGTKGTLRSDFLRFVALFLRFVALLVTLRNVFVKTSTLRVQNSQVLSLNGFRQA